MISHEKTTFLGIFIGKIKCNLDEKNEIL